MRLQDFITESVLQIINGIHDAQKKNNTDARINPSSLRLGSNVEQRELYDFDTHMLLSNVEFDVAVTTEESKGIQGGIGIFVGAVGLGSKGESGSKSTSLSRIRFNVPILLPKGNVSQPEISD
jgi:hypothetical protein